MGFQSMAGISGGWELVGDFGWKGIGKRKVGKWKVLVGPRRKAALWVRSTGVIVHRMSHEDEHEVLVLCDAGEPSLSPMEGISGILDTQSDPSMFQREHLDRASVVFVGQVTNLSSAGVGGVASMVDMLVSRMPKLKWVHSQSAGVGHLLGPGLAQSLVTLTNARGVYSRSLAEFCLLSMLYFCKDIPRIRDQQSRREWTPFVIEELHGKTVGVVGFGDIGRAAAEKAKIACSVRVLALRRNPEKSGNDNVADELYGPDRLIDMVRQCHFIVCAAPDTPATRGMISREVIGAMRSDAVFINVGRGTIVDEEALCEALKNRKIRGAALDVVTKEPLDPASPLYTLSNVLLSPHTADQTATFKHESTEFFVEMLRDFRAGKALRNIVDKHAGY
eukprot:CAMPEP_0184690078 /NCGR_PEP_ID=MMETSP0312-20130426/31018_1 /TAXON_ID=31354 /ORGANISM="Compsopogon coeruleus, Strain SAG 36.94" /LENGTH=390 /DNA_ID=CAMNT_0027147511 /DNA_START=1767 /DNA_END=2939 /DNA_ORIENTATION=+